MQIELPHDIDEATAAAIMAAVSLALAERPSLAAAPGQRSAWAAAGTLAGQGLPGAREPLRWGSADRAGRAARWTSGTTPSFHDW